MEFWHPVVTQIGADVSQKLLPLSSGLKERSNMKKKELHNDMTWKLTVYKSGHVVNLQTGGVLEKLKLCQPRNFNYFSESVSRP